MPQTEPELSKIQVFVFFDAVSVDFPRDFFKYMTLKLCITCFDENVAPFRFKNTSDDSKGNEKFQFLRFSATYVIFESFWCQNVGKPSRKTELLSQLSLKGISADFGWKMSQN